MAFSLHIGLGGGMIGPHEYNHAAARRSGCMLPWKKFLRIRCSEVAPEAILGPKLASVNLPIIATFLTTVYGGQPTAIY